MDYEKALERYPHAIGKTLTVCQLLERWRGISRATLDGLVISKQLVATCNGVQPIIDTSDERGIFGWVKAFLQKRPDDLSPHVTGPRAFENWRVEDMFFTDSLPDEAVIDLPSILDFEETHPECRNGAVEQDTATPGPASYDGCAEYLPLQEAIRLVLDLPSDGPSPFRNPPGMRIFSRICNLHHDLPNVRTKKGQRPRHDENGPSGDSLTVYHLGDLVRWIDQEFPDIPISDALLSQIEISTQRHSWSDAKPEDAQRFAVLRRRREWERQTPGNLIELALKEDRLQEISRMESLIATPKSGEAGNEQYPIQRPKAPNDNPPKKRTRRDKLHIAIEAALQTLNEKLKREPTASEVFDYLREQDETGCIVDNKPNMLVWEDSRGKYHDITLKTLANRLSRLRNPR